MQITTQRLSQVLFETDPLNTCCRENDCFDEYDSIAACTVNLMKGNVSFDKALFQVISEMFDEDMSESVDYETIKIKLTL